MDNYLNASQICSNLGISKRQLWRWKTQETFPAPDIAQGKIVRWSESTVMDWIDEQKKTPAIKQAFKNEPKL